MNRANQPYPTNDGDREVIKQRVERAVAELLSALNIDRHSDHNTRDTPKRVARMYVDEVMAGRFHPAPDVTDFPNAANLDEVYVVGPCDVRSMCSHHFVPIMGKAWIAVLPSQRVMGLSKFSRLLRWVMSRPQIQEEATVQVADLIEQAIQPRGLAVVVKAQHMCMLWRGVQESESWMTTSVMRGVFRDDHAARDEALRLIGMTAGGRQG